MMHPVAVVAVEIFRYITRCFTICCFVEISRIIAHEFLTVATTSFTVYNQIKKNSPTYFIDIL